MSWVEDMTAPAGETREQLKVRLLRAADGVENDVEIHGIHLMYVAELIREAVAEIDGPEPGRTREWLLARLKAIAEERVFADSFGAYPDATQQHPAADEALLEYINDPEVRAAYEAIERWFS